MESSHSLCYVVCKRTFPQSDIHPHVCTRAIGPPPLAFVPQNLKKTNVFQRCKTSGISQKKKKKMTHKKSGGVHSYLCVCHYFKSISCSRSSFNLCSTPSFRLCPRPCGRENDDRLFCHVISMEDLAMRCASLIWLINIVTLHDYQSANWKF